LGKTPLANSYLTKEQLKEPEPSFPLETYFCEKCGLVQLLDIVPGDVLFRNYLYISSTAPSYIQHFEMFAKEIVERFKLTRDSFVVEMGSNDGIFLIPLKKLGVRTLGVDPAENIAKIAAQSGVETYVDFFTEATAGKILEQKGKAAVIAGSNVFAHIDDLDEVLRGVNVLLDDDGVFVVEATHMVDMLQKRIFDLIYHEHVSYYCVRPLQHMLRRFDMEIFDVKKVPTAGGSIRVYAKKVRGRHPISDSVSEFLELEKKLGMDKLETYLNYGVEIESIKKNLIGLLEQLKSQGKRIVGYGAAAKGNTLLNYFGIGINILDYIVDKSPLKHGLYTPGMHIPIVSPDKINQDNPDYVLILAWNFADDIIKQHQDYASRGGKFIVPLPEIAVR
jgi:2-polyprenyl-3-methyl-5-hydroxy-6-metoxy-1,4-benzoquinol methylase